MKIAVKWQGERGLDFFLRNESRYRATLDIIRKIHENEPLRFTQMRDLIGINWVLYVRQVLVPEGYVGTKGRGIYFITQKGHELVMDLENKYKEDKMKILYGRVL